MLKPQLGEVRVFGEPAWTLSGEAKARIGYVPQTPALYPWMSVGQIIDYQASFYPHWNDDLIERLRNDWGLHPSDKVGPLSVGQQQKLSILLAIGHEPDLLVLDEPAAALDPEARRSFIRTVLDLVGKGRHGAVLDAHHVRRRADCRANRDSRRGSIAVDEELDRLKERVKRLHVTSRTPLPAGFSVPGSLRLDGATAQKLSSASPTRRPK